jgi:hypothetical protein
MIRYQVSVVAAALGAAVMGCTDVEEGEEIGETEQLSVGASACATASPLVSPDGTSQGMGPDPSCSITNQTVTSPNTSYDWSPNACGHTYIGQFTGTTGRAFGITVTDGGPTLDEETCPLVGIVGAAHGLRVADSQWHLIGKTVFHGEWISGPFFNTCVFVKDPGQVSIPYVTGVGLNNYSRVRVEGVSVGFFFKRRVKVGISYGTGPC